MKLHGIYVPLVTPFKEDGSLDIATLEQLTEQFIAKGVAGLVACGTTGEYYTLTEEEREAVLTTVAKIAKGRVTLIAGINDLSTAGTVKRAKEAAALGYEAFMLAPPAYSLPDQAGLIAHYETVAEATDIPIIMYNFPARVGIEIEYESVLHLAKNPKIIGLKESSGDFSRALRLLQTPFEDFEIVCGCDDQPVDFFFWGSKSWIAGAGNVFPEEQVTLFNATQKGDWDLARNIMKEIYPAIHSMESGNYNQKAKLGCLKATLSVGKVRLPLSDLSDEERDAFLAFFR
ncbi:dihydrodipicolinate synthase family protein [Ignatzschineria indica]|uniref:4-hydroxy-tetrahydrodipicolinate synthase n=1 Tax=Ignatzschineria indica TaxID=472583 RepID=A0A2U2AP54_9GAMM|nr:4-hydroxy-tetrahydrodipicolinate synthase [Ignatzschineria indica]PWD84991.1 4-hydroxy-tetrahydrodipicolinate synthase [Ignatzschineria indica]GGZ80662.1 dihydrodipicolinate synthase family protein [Ignatzschineria indica]